MDSSNLSASSSPPFWTETVWVSSFNVNIYKYLKIDQLTSEEESVAEAMLLATASASVPCHVTNHMKDCSQEIFSDAHLVLGLFIYLGHCDALFRLHLLTATVRFDALNDFSDSLSFSSNLERTYSLHDGCPVQGMR